MIFELFSFVVELMMRCCHDRLIIKICAGPDASPAQIREAEFLDRALKWVLLAAAAAGYVAGVTKLMLRWKSGNVLKP